MSIDFFRNYSTYFCKITKGIAFIQKSRQKTVQNKQYNPIVLFELIISSKKNREKTQECFFTILQNYDEILTYLSNR